MSATATPERPTLVDRAREEWVRRLIDLSRRNNLLYFRDLKTGTLDLSAGNREAIDALLDGERSVTLGQLLPEADAVRTAAVVREIGRKAQSNLEEKGLQTLFLALGMASWAPDDGGRPPEAAVLLIPVALELRGMGRSIALRRSGEIQVNLVLLHVLATRFGLKLDPEALLEQGMVAGEQGEEPTFSPEALFEALRLKAAAVPGFGVRWRTVAGNFSFQKMAMVKDLQESGAVLTGHDLVAAMAGDTGAVKQLAAEVCDVDPATFDQQAPDLEYYVVDADSSQQRVAELVFQGQSVVIQGPPGTGKSQTITNLIAGEAARGRRVLFVAEKRAALEVVQRRLEREGLGHLALDLHGADLTRKEVMAKIAANLSLVADALPVPVDEVHRRFTENRRRLVEHVQRMHVKRQPSGLSVYELQGRLLRLPREAATTLRWRSPDLDRLDLQAAEQVEAALRELAGYESLVLETDSSPWTGARLEDGAAAQAAVDLALRAQETYQRVLSDLEQVARTAWLRRPATLAEAAALLSLLHAVDQTLSRFAEGIWEADLDALARALAPASRGTVTHAMQWVVNGAYRGALKQVRSLLRAGQPDDAPDLHSAVLGAAEQRRRWLELAESSGTRPIAVPDAEAMYARLKELVHHLDGLGQTVRLGDWKGLPLAELGARLDSLAADSDTPHYLATVSLQEQKVRQLGAGLAVDEIRRGKPAAALWAQRFRYAWLASHLDKARLEDPALAGFKGRTHDEAVAEFRRLDRQRIGLAARRVVRKHAENAVRAMNEFPEQTALVRHEAQKKSRHLPLRKLLAKAPDVLTALFPCWMASPLSVSQLIDADRRYFDVVLFDEASQVLPEDAVPAIMRADQLVVAGDEYQLPPTRFFADGADEEDEADDEEAATVGFESLLKLSASFLPARMLQWHYRSQDESLIAFSNRHIYGSGLVTFPGTGGPRAVSHVLVEQEPGRDGNEESSGREVQRVVELILAHAEQHPELSLGVITMGIKHADRVQAALDAALQTRPDLDAFFDTTRPERFFMKNLERVQGDERDAIILSVGYGKDRSGNLPYRFGPLLYEGGERRLNVAVTRARKQMTLVSSFTHLEMDPSRSKARGVELLRLYLQYAASQGRLLGDSGASDVPLNEFEQDVRQALEARGIHLLPQWGVSQYRIDFVAQHPRDKGRFVLAIECDGATYHSAPTARDRDRLRQQHLEALGWRFHRIWSTDWFLRRDEEIERAVKAYTEAVAQADAAQSAPLEARVAAVVPPHQEPQRKPRPPVPEREKIADYSQQELVALIRWIRSDGRLRTDEEIIDEMVEELGFGRRGARIEEAIRKALEQAT